MDKKSYFVNVLEAKDGKIAETMNFNFGGHHDLGNMAERARESGLFAKDKHAKEFVLAMRFMHHVRKIPTWNYSRSSHPNSMHSSRKSETN